MSPKAPAEKLGPYIVGRRLGKGGMGSVYLAEHQDSGERVALKTLEEIDAALIHALRLEISSLTRLHHPGVVKVRQSGIHEGIPWCAMELLDGMSLGQHLNRVAPALALGDGEEDDEDDEPDARESPWLSQLSEVLGLSVDWESLDPFDSMHGFEAIDGLTVRKRRLLGWMGQLCRALAYVHGEGVLHCDLKPANILVTEDGRAMLLDFGLAVEHGGRLGLEQLENAGMRAGTAHYMAPEIIRGLDYDARADLYAVGCLLYQVVTGSVPFPGRRAKRVFKRHLTETPEALARHGVHVPAELESLIMALLSKAPMERPGSAMAVVHVLGEMGIDTGEVPAPPAKPYLFRPRLVGRGPMVSALASRLGEARGGAGGIVVLAGPGGVGKTTLAAEAVRRARRLRMKVLTGQCQWIVKRGLTSPSALPLQGWTRTLRRLSDACRAGGPSVTRKLLGDRGGTLALCAPFLRELPGFEEDDDEPRAVDPKAARRNLYRCLQETAEVLSRGQPMLFIIEDVQWADGLTVDSLLYLAEELRRRPWLILATCRTDEDIEHVQPLFAEELTSVVRVPRLDGEAVGELLGEMLGRSDVPPALSTFVSDRSAGNPFFAGEQLRLLMEQGALQRTSAGEWDIDALATDSLESLPLPRSVRGIVESRLEGLDAAAAATLRAVAVLGREANLSLVRQVANLEPAQLDAALADLDRRDILEKAGSGRVRIVHDRIREAAYAATGEAILATLHGRAAQAMDAAPELDRPHLGTLALHWHLAGETGRAREKYTLAARQALARHAREEAEGYFATAIELYEPDPRALALRLDVVESVLLLEGRHDEANHELSQVVRLAHERRARGEEARARCLLGQLFRQTGRVFEAEKQLTRALEIYRRVGDAKGQATALMTLGLRHVDLGEIAQGVLRLEESLAHQRAIGDLLGESEVLNHLGACKVPLGQLEQARELYDSSMSVSKALGDRSGMARALSGLAGVDHHRGRRPEALRRFEEALTRARELGFRELEGRVLTSLGILALERAWFGQAWDHFENGLKVGEDAGNISVQCANLVGLGEVAAHQGLMGDADRTFREALDLSKSIGDRLRCCDALLGMADVALVEAELSAARRYVEDALDIALDVGLRPREARARRQLSRLELAGGAVFAARHEAEAAMVWASECGDGRSEAYCLLCLAAASRRSQDFSAWDNALTAAEALAEGVGDAYLDALVAAARALYHVDGSELADEPLAAARRGLLDLDCTTESCLGRALAEIDVALEAQDTWLL